MFQHKVNTCFCFLVFFATAISAAIINDISAVQHVNFDFIIVGGGTAGNVLANRLTENKHVQVLVLEAGPSNEGVINSQVPWLGLRLWHTEYDWNYTTVPQSGLGGRTVYLPRGHMLGGSSSINFMMYTRASSEDYDRLAKYTGDNGWSWKNLQHYFLKNEKWTLPADHRDIRGDFDPALHNVNGINSVSLPGFKTSVDDNIFTALHQLGGDFSYKLDYNSGNPLGVGWLQTTINGAFRSSSATSYLGSKYISRPNLHVLVNAQVSRLLTVKGGKSPSFRGVEFRQNDGTLKQLTAIKEVILSAGAVGTPHILLNSGIGDSEALSAVGVKPIVNLPDVGENMMDHPVIANPWTVNGNDTFERIRDPANFDALFQQWQTQGTGPFVDTVASFIGFHRVGVKLEKDLTAGPNTAHYEHLFANGLVVPNPLVPQNASYFGIATAVVSPASRGSIKLNSSDPFAPPLIDPGLMKEESDRVIMREAIKHAFKFVTAPVWSDYIVGPAGPLANATTDELLDEYVVARATTFFHPAGTAKMSPKGASYGVLDPDLKVKKTANLRVVDASVFPYIPSGHLQATVYAVAERAADIIKDEYSL